MGELVYFNKKEIGITKYMTDIIDASKLKKGVDFDVISFVILDKDLNVHSLQGFTNKSSVNLFSNVVGGYRAFVESLLANNSNIEGVAETPFPKSNSMAFYKLNEEIDIDLATEIGLGVVVMNGERMIYCPLSSGDPTDAILEMMLIKLYIQLKHPEEIDEKLKKSYLNYQHLMFSGILANKDKHIRRLKEIFKIV